MVICFIAEATMSRPVSVRMSELVHATSYIYWWLFVIYSSFTQKRLALLAKRYCNNINIKLVFNSFKIGSLFSVKDPIPSDLRSRVVYKFSCAGCTASYVGETVRHLATRVNEHLISDRASHIFKHLERNETCLRLCSKKCFQVLDSAATEFSLKIKEAIHIKRENTINLRVLGIG